MFENRRVVELAQNVKVFWNLKAGVMREGAPDGVPEAGQKSAVQRQQAAHQAKRIAQLRDFVSRKDHRIAQQERRIEQLQGWLSGKDENLDRLRRQLDEKNRELEGQRAEGGGDSRADVPIFFVVGRQRSGTNWLMRTLNAHPEVLCKGEGRFFGREVRREHLKGMKTSEHIKFKMQPSSLYNAVAENEYLRLWIERSVWTRDDDPEEHLGKLTREAVKYFLTESLSKTKKRMVGDKTPLTSPEVVEEISTVCPEAKVIHIIRDGRDAAISRMHHLWNRATDEGGIHELTPEELDKRDRYRQDPEAFLRSGESIFAEERLREAAEGWANRVGAAYRDGPALLGENYAEVRYEDLLARPNEEFARLFSFLGAASDPQTVASCVEQTSFERRSGGRAPGEEDSRSGVRKGVAGDWKGVFSEGDKEVFKRVAGGLLVDLGYEEGPNW
ncbi:MAG TPA: sulfotransferase [Rubrobacter sp.]|nr:sulfotransferase [Rubrobacter sp.]